jgi:hypothetical protein
MRHRHDLKAFAELSIDTVNETCVIENAWHREGDAAIVQDFGNQFDGPVQRPLDTMLASVKPRHR